MSTTSIKPQTETEVAPRSVWQNRNYVILFLSGAILAVGGKVYELALPLILYNFTNHSSVAMTSMRAIEFLPNLFLALFIGVLVDRVNKKRFALTSVACQAVLLFLLYGLHRLGVERLWIYYLAGFLMMTCQYAYGNSRMTILKQALPRELLTAANANNSSISTLIGILGPAITGFLLMMADLNNGLLLTGVACFCGLLLTSRLQLSATTGARLQNTTFWQDLREGWVVLRQNKALWQITMLVIFLNSTAGMVDAMTVFFAKDHLQLPNGWLGVVLAIEGLGGLVGSRLVAWTRRRLGTGRTMGFTILLLGLCDGLLVVATNVSVFALALFGIGLFSSIQSICIWTFRQESTPAELIGRISGLTGSLFKVGMVWTIFGSGWLTLWFGASTVYAVACAINLVVFLVYRRLSLRRLV